MSTRTLTRSVAFAAMLAGTGAVVVGAGPAAAQDPPGNNGTVKIDDTPFDSHPNNEPHVGCVVQVDLYGYDAGDLTATVTFEAWAPTNEGEDDELLTDTLDIGEDPAGGGTDLDASGTYDLTNALADITPHPQQGWHVRLTVHAEGSQGADVKHKVFWVQECPPPPTTTSTSTTSTSTTSTSTTSTSTTMPTTVTTGTTVTTVPTTPTTTPGTTVATVPTTPTTTAAVGGTLPRTGTNTAPLVAAGLALIAIGVGMLTALRLRRTV